VRPGDKPVIPPDRALLALATRSIPGGGALNSILMARSIDCEAALRFVDAAAEDEAARRRLAAADIETVFLGLHRPADHAVLSCGNNKLIFKSPLETAGVAPARDVLSQAIKGEALLCNSVKDRLIMTHAAAEAAHRRIRMHAMLTPSLPAEYLTDAVLPWATTVMAGSDDLEKMFGIPVGADPGPMLDAVRWIAERTVYADMVFVTLGENGILAADLPADTIFHVRLRKNAAQAVQSSISESPLRVCGAGDAAAAGIFIFRERGSALMPGLSGLPPAVAASMAACAAALSRIGLASVLRPPDFDVYEHPLRNAYALARG
jgi:sugar/nucleoside kinase (ribokinase family)